MTSISSFPIVQTSLKLAIKCDVNFSSFLYINDSVIVDFHIKSCNSLKRLLKQPKTFTMLQTPFRYFYVSIYIYINFPYNDF